METMVVLLFTDTSWEQKSNIAVFVVVLPSSVLVDAEGLETMVVLLFTDTFWEQNNNTAVFVVVVVLPSSV